MDPHYYFLFGHSGQTRLLASLNDIPFYRSVPDEVGNNRSGVADHLLVPGSNCFELEIFGAGPSDGLRYSLAIDHDHDNAVVRCDWPEDRGAVEQWVYPYVTTRGFDVPPSVRRPVWMDAPAGLFPPEGTDGLHEAVRTIHNAFATRDVDAVMHTSTLKLSEYQRYYPDEDVFREPTIRRHLEGLFPRVRKVRALELEQLLFRCCAGGRVAYVTRYDGEYPIDVSISDTHGIRSDLWLTKHNGTWKTFR